MITNTTETTETETIARRNAIEDWERSASLISYAQNQRIIAADSHRATMAPMSAPAPVVVFGNAF